MPFAPRCFAAIAPSNSTTALPCGSCPVTIRRVDMSSIAIYSPLRLLAIAARISLPEKFHHEQYYD
jgi:hypothetical protein